MPRFELMDPRKLWISFITALFLLFGLISFTHFAGVIFGGDGARAAADINESGRQRMLSQRMLYFARRHIEYDYEDQFAGAELANALQVFLTSHNRLVSQDERPLSPELFDIYFAENGPQLDKAARQFADDALFILTGHEADRVLAYDRMADVGVETLLRDLNAAVTAFENEAKRLESTSKLLGNVGYALAIVALFLVGFFIFRPAHKSIVQAIEDMMENNEQLRQQEAEAFAALEDSEDAWAEAEEARRTSDVLVENTRANTAELIQQLSKPMAATDRWVQKFGTGNLSPDQREALIDMSRIRLVMSQMIEDFAHNVQSESRAEGEAERPFQPVDLARTACSAVSTLDRRCNVDVTLENANKASTKTLGRPVATLRLMLSAIDYVASDLGASDVHVRMDTRPQDNEISVSLEVHGQNPELPSAMEDEAGEVAFAFAPLVDALNAKIELRRETEDSVTLMCSWQAKSATIRGSKKKPKTRKVA